MYVYEMPGIQQDPRHPCQNNQEQNEEQSEGKRRSPHVTPLVSARISII